MRRRIAILVATVAVAVAGCSLLFPFDGYGPGEADAQAPDAAVPVEAAAEAGCALSRWPERPLADDPSAGDVDLTFAMDKVDFGISDSGVPLPGRDIDGLCTCPDPSPCKSTAAFCDLDGGVDNGAAALLAQLSSFGQIVDQARIDEYIDNGKYLGFLIQLRRYNGTPNDTSVQFSAFRSNGTSLDQSGANIRPRKDGTDVWTLERDSVVGGSGPPYIPTVVDGNAYVANGIFVAHANPPFVLPGSGRGIPLKVEEGVVIGRLVREGPSWRIEDGVTVGRLSTRTLLSGFAAIPDPFDKSRSLCGDSGTYQALKPQICAAAESTSSLATEGKGQACNAFSFGIGYHAVAALAGDIGKPPIDAGLGCGADWSDDCTP